MENISPLGWVTIGCFGLLLIVMNVGLIALLKNKPRLEMKAPREENRPVPDQVMEVIRDPFGRERKQIDELSGLVEQLGEKKNQNPTPDRKP